MYIIVCSSTTKSMHFPPPRSLLFSQNQQIIKRINKNQDQDTSQIIVFIHTEYILNNILKHPKAGAIKN